MVWNKTPENVCNRIKELLADFTLRYVDIAKITGVSTDTVYTINSTMDDEFKAARYSGINRSAKQKSNPMTGKTGTKHHNSVEGPTKSGPYLAIWAPVWWTGRADGGRVLLHQVIWCAANGHTELPKGHVVHHKDHNKSNNSVENLTLMTRKAHARHHAAYNFFEGATTIPEKEVGNSVPEAPSILSEFAGKPWKEVVETLAARVYYKAFSKDDDIV